MLALESTIISHGMPYPQNLETAKRVEAEAAAGGAVPLTIAILDGLVHIGLTSAQLERLAKMGPKQVQKCSTRDLPVVLAGKGHGSTTVAATLYLANQCDIPLFVTGGIGGVHRGVAETWDISADLLELGRTPMALVCAGVKSILDIGKTLEVLESHGVTVTTLGQPEFPAFFTPKSAFRSPSQINSIEEIARTIFEARSIGMPGAQLIAVPVPLSGSQQGASSHGVDAALSERIESATSAALAESVSLGLSGRDVTPFLLRRISELTGGESLAQNISLILNNVAVGAQITRSLNRLQRESLAVELPFSSPIVVGSANFDVLGQVETGRETLTKTKNSGKVSQCFGGVGRNMAEALGRLGANPLLISAVGSDAIGRLVLDWTERSGVDCSAVERVTACGTSVYMAALDQRGDLFTSVGDLAAVTLIGRKQFEAQINRIREAPLLLADGNLTSPALTDLSVLCAELGVPMMFECTSVEKCGRIIEALRRGIVDLISPSQLELIELERLLNTDAKPIAAPVSPIDRALLLLSSIRRTDVPFHMIVKLGSDGAALISQFPGEITPRVQSFSAPADISIVNTSGAGDSLVGAFAWHFCRSGAAALQKIIRGKSMPKLPLSNAHLHDLLWLELCSAVQLGMRAAEMSLECPETVNPSLNPANLLRRQMASNDKRAT